MVAIKIVDNSNQYIVPWKTVNQMVNAVRNANLVGIRVVYGNGNIANDSPKLKDLPVFYRSLTFQKIYCDHQIKGRSNEIVGNIVQ